jgi:CHAT domain-containing protein
VALVTGPIHEIAADISKDKLILSALPRCHPLRPLCTSHLASRFLERYELLDQKDDLDKSILYFTESLIFPPLSWLAHGTMILTVLSTLALSLLKRSRVFKEPEDAISAAKCLRHLRELAYTPFAFLRQPVTALLVAALATQMGLKASDVVQALEEMAVLTHELLTSDPFGVFTTDAITAFALVLSTELPLPSSDQLSNQIIECLRLARIHKPEIRQVPFSLALCLRHRYFDTMNDELDEAASILDEVIASCSPGDELVAPSQMLAADIAMIRLAAVTHPEHSEEAIYRARAFLASSSSEEALNATWSKVLERAAKKRFTYFDPIGVNALFSDSPRSRPVPPDDSELTPNRSPLERLLDRIRGNNITDIDEVIELGRTTLASSDPSVLKAPLIFGEMLFEAFKRTNEIEFLNESIDTLRPLLAICSSRFLRIEASVRLVISLATRSHISAFHQAQDLREVTELFPEHLNKEEGQSRWQSLLGQFHVACFWALLARDTQHPSVSAAYEVALSLMQDTLLFAPTVQLQHTTLAADDMYSKMPLDYVSYQVYLCQLEKAIETLERGRCLLWSEMRHLRTSSDQLVGADPDLRDKYAEVNRELEELTKSIPPSYDLNMNDVIADDVRAGDQFGHLLMRQRGLLKEREQLISQIRALPGFDRFLASPSFDDLRSAASSGPVIIINHSKPRSDIIMLLHNSTPSLISTSTGFYHRATALKDKLLVSRVNHGLDSNKYDQSLASVLEELYKLVGKPVIDRLRQLQVPEQSRIWWCPTSVFCSLPLHAMGPIPSDDSGELHYFLDLYISSYTPSLSALIQSRSRDPGSRSSDRPSVLLVAQPDPSLPTVGGEIDVVRALDTDVTSLISEAATSAAVLDGFQHHQFVHFACHGTLEDGKPFEAGFELHRHERLTLLEIVRTDLPTAEFAFLSACHTAEVTEGSIIDEALHLAAAVQYSGFRSVVGTMWAMADADGRDLAENFYKSLFSNSRRDQGIPYHERSAKALRFAVKKLRRKRRISLERWVNFVHYGA